MLDKATILIVDDTPDNLSLMSEVLRDKYKVKVANNGEKALKITHGDVKPDLILLDIMMPEMDGYQICKALKADPTTQDIPVIFLTAKVQEDDVRKGLELGAVDYITKPISVPILLARVHNHLKLKEASDFLRDKNVYLEKEVTRRTEEVLAIQDVMIHALASLAETRDNDTGHHIKRTQIYIQNLAAQLVDHPRFKATLTPGFLQLLYKSAPLHDIGKVGIPDAVLLKPGRLTSDEFEIMKTHSEIGKDAIENAEASLGIKVPFLTCAKEITLSHHEKWDGSGYLDGIGGDEIPICARLMALADVYDALVCKRVYKQCMAHEQAVDIIVEGRAGHFDPDVVDAFLAIQEEFRAIAKSYAD